MDRDHSRVAMLLSDVADAAGKFEPPSLLELIDRGSTRQRRRTLVTALSAASLVVAITIGSVALSTIGDQNQTAPPGTEPSSSSTALAPSVSQLQIAYAIATITTLARADGAAPSTGIEYFVTTRHLAFRAMLPNIGTETDPLSGPNAPVILAFAFGKYPPGTSGQSPTVAWAIIDADTHGVEDNGLTNTLPDLTQLGRPKYWTRPLSSHPVSIPTLLNKTKSDAESMLKHLGLIAVTESVQSSAIPVGRVVAQSPTAGTQVPAGTAVTIRISSGR